MASDCKKNETSGCKSCGPEKTCHPSTPAAETPCPTDCKPACVCLEGYVKGPEGHCILEADCPKS
ncbi:hypothetical protein ANCCAN_06834 [Ancylostoma caninum]|uniref:Trypsin Inhibitor like cysteine rich domain protein n=1 Tax=Ancylostoma caninum TaxID=29170 RepID=A0A368GVR6_ANCCA|nr:hypothetical protein ANCCAN_06834 [Ancylostoma caninum]